MVKITARFVLGLSRGNPVMLFVQRLCDFGLIRSIYSALSVYIGSKTLVSVRAVNAVIHSKG